MVSEKLINSSEIKKTIGHLIIYRTIVFFMAFCFLTEEAIFSWKIFFSRLKRLKRRLKRREMWFLAGVRMYVCVCVCVYVSDFQRLKPR